MSHPKVQTALYDIQKDFDCHILLSPCSTLLFSFGYSELQINRQNSSESLSSLTSTTSHSSMGSLKEQEAKKKKKKSWVRKHWSLTKFVPKKFTRSLNVPSCMASMQDNIWQEKQIHFHTFHSFIQIIRKRDESNNICINLVIPN